MSIIFDNKQNLSDQSNIIRIHLPAYILPKIWLLLLSGLLLLIYVNIKNTTHSLINSQTIQLTHLYDDDNPRQKIFALLDQRYRLLKQLTRRNQKFFTVVLQHKAMNNIDIEIPKTKPLYIHNEQTYLRNLVAHLFAIRNFSIVYDKNLLYIPHIIPTAEKKNFRINSFFGLRRDPIHKKYISHHNGIDIKAKRGHQVFAAANGVVQQVRWLKTGYGNMIRISHYLGYETVYAHLDKIFVRPGAPIQAGQVIATVGSTGRVTGPHLHYEVRYKNQAINPLQFGLQD